MEVIRHQAIAIEIDLVQSIATAYQILYNDVCDNRIIKIMLLSIGTNSHEICVPATFIIKSWNMNLFSFSIYFIHKFDYYPRG